MEVDAQLTKTASKLTLYGFTATAILLLCAGLYVGFTWDRVVKLEPNEFADLLAGVFAPLAFLWLVIGYLQQGVELRNSVEALRLQSNELANSVEQQRQLVEATREQVEHERTVTEAREEADRKAAAPIFRMDAETRGHGISGPVVSYRLRNFGKPCHDFEVKVVPNGIRHTHPLFESGGSVPIDLEFAKGSERQSETVFVSYLDGRGSPGSAVFEIPVVDSEYYGPCYGDPELVEPE